MRGRLCRDAPLRELLTLPCRYPRPAAFVGSPAAERPGCQLQRWPFQTSSLAAIPLTEACRRSCKLADHRDAPNGLAPQGHMHPSVGSVRVSSVPRGAIAPKARRSREFASQGLILRPGRKNVRRVPLAKFRMRGRFQPFSHSLVVVPLTWPRCCVSALARC